MTYLLRQSHNHLSKYCHFSVRYENYLHMETLCLCLYTNLIQPDDHYQQIHLWEPLHYYSIYRDILSHNTVKADYYELLPKGILYDTQLIQVQALLSRLRPPHVRYYKLYILYIFICSSNFNRFQYRNLNFVECRIRFASFHRWNFINWGGAKHRGILF